jgi:hypothetical protein
MAQRHAGDLGRPTLIRDVQNFHAVQRSDGQSASSSIGFKYAFL